MCDVERGIAELLAEGVQVAWTRGRVIGLRHLRARVGGDADRVRSMAIVALQKLKGGIEKDALLEAREFLRGPRSPSPLAGLSTEERKKFLDFAAAFAASARRAFDRGETPHDVADSSRGDENLWSLETTRHEEQPAASRAEVAVERARQNAPSTPAHGALDALLEERRRREIPTVPEFNPFLLPDDE
ncbi:hypothetical protein [Falsiroseomonas sp. HW251]|uniref:hypothetical protein n=1 Tax=Falsiroseomonas sp. HW251 TaxID=3390998 RepID=UPI003D31651F